MEKYNPHYNSISDEFSSEIAFVKISDDFEKNFIPRSEYWFNFKNNKQGYFQVDDDLGILFKKEQFLNRYKEVKDFSRARRYHTLIKVINDKNTPILNGKIMLFTYGFKINQILTNNESKVYNKIFKLIIKRVGPYPDFDNSYFTDIDYHIEDKSLNLKDSLIVYPKLDMIKDLEREHKLKKIMNSIKTPQL
jgi:hypothetical protein